MFPFVERVWMPRPRSTSRDSSVYRRRVSAYNATAHNGTARHGSDCVARCVARTPGREARRVERRRAGDKNCEVEEVEEDGEAGNEP